MRHQKFQSASRGAVAEFKPIKIRPRDESSRVIIFQMQGMHPRSRVGMKRGHVFPPSSEARGTRHDDGARHEKVVTAGRRRSCRRVRKILIMSYKCQDG